MMCGYNKPVPSAYDFHHRDPSQKELSISGKTISLEILIKEVDKCDLLCRNCHAELHDSVYAEKRKNAIVRYKNNLLKRLQIKQCIFCGKDFQCKKRTQRFCSSYCFSQSRKVHIIVDENKERKISRNPPKEELEKLIPLYSWRELGRKYGVSDNAVKKWARQYGIKFGRRRKPGLNESWV